jgi:hypothetical protein
VIVRRCIWRGDSRTTGESAMVSTAEILRFAQDDDTFGHTETENLATASSTNVSLKSCLERGAARFWKQAGEK